jgi:hypothetical protein
MLSWAGNKATVGTRWLVSLAWCAEFLVFAAIFMDYYFLVKNVVDTYKTKSCTYYGMLCDILIHVYIMSCLNHGKHSSLLLLFWGNGDVRD